MGSKKGVLFGKVLVCHKASLVGEGRELTKQSIRSQLHHRLCRVRLPYGFCCLHAPATLPCKQTPHPTGEAEAGQRADQIVDLGSPSHLSKGMDVVRYAVRRRRYAAPMSSRTPPNIAVQVDGSGTTELLLPSVKSVTSISLPGLE